MEHILRVNMSTLTIEKQDVPEEYKLLGGRGLTSRIVFDEVEPTCDPLGPKNKVILAPGLLAGTIAPSSGRLSIGAKSPLTGGIKESNAGGTVAQKLARLGVKAVIIEGVPENKGTHILLIDEAGCKIIQDQAYKGLGNYETAAKLQEIYGKDAGILSIGPAGEYGYSISGIACTNIEGMPSRHAARGGLGSVLGSKGVKAVVVKPSKSKAIQYNQLKTFKEISSDWAKEIIPSKKVMTELGTASLVSVVNKLGFLPTRNFSQGSFEEAENMSGQKLAEIVKQRGGKTGHPCHPGCVIRCSNIFNDENGEYLTSGLEYETLVLTGSNLGISDLDAIAWIDRFCDDFGIDTMSTGATLGVAAEAGLATFGDIDSFKNLLNEMKERTTLGRVLGQGSVVTGRVFGVKRVPAVKGQSMSAYDPRGLKGTGVTYLTCPMGADHTAANIMPGRVGFRPETKDGAPHDSDDMIQVQISRDVQIIVAVFDVTGLCFFVGTTTENIDLMARLINARYGTNLSMDDLLDIALNAIKTEVEFNKRAGITKAQNRLPEFMQTEPLQPKGYTFNIPQEEIDSIWD
jgi:aldehyde:ferredoxin oxidoreductase